MRKKTGDTAFIKQMNTAVVLEAVMKQAPLSRAAISERTGLNKATVSNLVQDLIDRDLVVEIGTGQSSGGRRPVMLLFNSKAGYALGIDLGVNYIRGVLTDLSGEIVNEAEISLEATELDYVLERLYACTGQLLASAPESPYGVIGIGMGVPGIVNDTGSILFAPNLEWTQVKLGDLLEERFGLPVFIDNEANAGAKGEQRFGAGRGIANQIYVSVGIGIGTGIILNKELYQGASGFSGELGHLSIDLEGMPCRCGNNGCWELYASENALLGQARKLGFGSLSSLLHAADEGHDAAIKLFHNIGYYLGVGVANIINVFNPEVVLIGNRMSRARRWIEAALLETVGSRTLSYHYSNMRILFAELGEHSAVRGAAYFAISEFLAKVKG
ncbi:ROK family protein [Paenibacillus sp. GCM10012307]|uniref:ROK family transcriptional regulator n=1 Tax=Paenibacillus roseus TaxID=2798579 RepID=A0A934J8W7_9BACL|nr:ROK family transcriptional regulator [Paenibacillus roseus]MBJ6362826.1 ROK family transcriptional regulator [Paenibacillus roseus]